MATYTQILYHLVFGTKDHDGTLDIEHHDEVCSYIAGILKNKDCFAYKVGGNIDHIHILTTLHPSIGLADAVKSLKTSAGKWIKKSGKFPHFDGWQEGYGAFTCSWKDKGRIVNYIANQREHHHRKTFREEYIEMLSKCGIEFDEKHLC